MSFSVKVENLTKRYGETIALNEISFEVCKNELFGFIGPDGSGKTTLFRILTSLLIPDSGSASVEGFDVVKEYKKIRNICGYMPGKFSLYQDLSVEENLNFFATIFGTTLKDNYSLIKDIYSQIEPFKTRRAGNLSGGMKQKLALSCALIHKPLILFLDEPTTGVDAVSRLEFWEMLKRLKSSYITILVSTPYMEEASLCDRVALIQAGRIMQISKPEEIIQGYPYPLYSVTSTDKYKLLNDLKVFPKIHSVYLFGQTIHIAIKEDSIDLKELYAYLELRNHDRIEITSMRATIEDCFMELMQRER